MVKVREKNELIAVNAGENLEKLIAKKHVRPTKHSILLPYFDELENEADRNLQEIINGLMATFVTGNPFEAVDYCEIFSSHLAQFGLRMPRETFLKLVRFFYESIIVEDQHSDLLKIACATFGNMMKLAVCGTFGWKDMVLDWRPLYALFLKSVHGKVKPDPTVWLNSVLYSFSIFYHPEQHAPIWEAILEEFSAGNQGSMDNFTMICWSFLSIQGMSEEEIKKYAVDTWIKELWNIYLKAEMNTKWTIVVVDYISELSIYAPSAFDLSPYYDVLYTKMMRSFNLTVRDGKVAVGDGQENTTLSHLANIAAYTIGGPHSSLSHFQRLMQYILFNVHPLNSGGHMDNIGEFLNQFLSFIKMRLRKERLSHRKRRCSKEFYLTDKDIDAITESVADLVIMLLYSESYSNDFKLVYMLTVINRELVAPKLLDHLYSSLTAVSQPHRLSCIIESFSLVMFEIIRQPDAEFRAPRGITYDSEWLSVLEQRRKEWPTYTKGSEITNIGTRRLGSLRAHAFYIMEIFVNSIDVNDVNRTASVLKTLVVLFSSFPLMDFSAAIEFHGHEMSEDDRLLCVLSKRVPRLVEHAIDKILEVITCLSVCPSKSSGGPAAMAMSSESQQRDGDEEALLKTGINQCVNVVFERVDERIRERLFARLFAYLTTAEFANFIATDLLSVLVASAVWVSRSAFRKFATFICAKLKTLLTDEVQKSKNPPSTVLFHTHMARGLFSATHHIILENEPLLCEITELLLKCQNKAIYSTGSHGVYVLLFTLLTVNTEPTASPENEKFARPLNEWNPIKEWARCNHYKETVIKWYFPAKPEVEAARRIADRFFFPFIDKIQPGKLDRDELRRVTSHLLMILPGIDVFRHPTNLEYIPDIYTPYSLPSPSSSLGSICTMDFELKGPNGENAREMLLAMVERMMGQTHDPTALKKLSGIVYYCLGKRTSSLQDSDIEFTLSDAHRVLLDGTYGRITKASQHTMDELAFFKHSSVVGYHLSANRQPNDFDRRVIRCLVEFALDDYEKVRSAARNYLSINMGQIYRCRDMLIPQVVRVLTDSTLKNSDRLNGAISLMLELGWMSSMNSKVRLVIWDAVLAIKVDDDPLICTMFELICKYVKVIEIEPVYRPGNRETYSERQKTMTNIALSLTKQDGVWKQLLSPEGLAKQIVTWQDFELLRHTVRAELVDKLFARHIRNSALHHTRENLARTMVFHVQQETADEKTVRLMLAQMVDEQYDQRRQGRGWLAHYLQTNKPKSVRVNVVPPQRAGRAVTMESGIREDNVWIAYDSSRLPDTEEKWNEMTFVEKEKGACRWPGSISVVRKRKDGPPLESKTLNASELAIVEFFSSPSLVASFFEYRHIEKDEYTLPNSWMYRVIKYVIRNFSDAQKPLELFIGHLVRLLASRERKDQLLAAEIFTGVVLGMKHRPFAELDAFWRDMTVRLDQFLNIMIVEAEGAWTTALCTVLDHNTDLRRVWWLVESFMHGAKKGTSVTEFQQAFRLNTMLFRRWRYGEIVNRVAAIAWNKLPLTLTDSLRYTIAKVLQYSTQVRQMNSTATFVNVDLKFVPQTVDETIRRMIEKIPQLNDSGYVSTAKSSRSDPVVTSPCMLGEPRAKKARRRSLSTDSTGKLSLTYFRTLLEYLMQYYETATCSWTPALVQILPKLMEYANEDDYELSEETCRDVDITQNSAFVIHDYMSGTWLREEFVEDIVKLWYTTFSSCKKSWRLRMSVIKFVQASVYSNMYPLSRQSRQQLVEKLLFEAIFDSEVSVRKEAAQCLLLLIHCGYICVTDAKVDELARILNSKTDSEARVHGAALALGALVLAFPFTVPADKILKPLKTVNSSSCKRALVRQSVTEILREFRRQHRDDWEKTKKVLGSELTFDIENATAPTYYA